VPEEKRATVAHVVAGDLLLAAELVSGILPVSLLDALEDAGVRILPRSFQELNGQCNCPDNMGGSGGFYGASVKRAGDPCKHQAACMFEVIGELDKNPRTLLALRGIDVDSLVGTGGGDAGAAASDAGELPYPLPTTAFCAGGGEARVVRGKLTFRRFQSSAKTIAQVLAPSPMFSKDDFSAVLAAFYASLTEKKIASALGAEEAWEKKLDIDAVRPLLERAKYTLSVPESLSVRNVRVIVESDMWSLSDGDPGSEARLVDGAAASDNADSAGERDPSSAAKTPKETLGTLPFETATPSEADGVSPRVRISLDTFRRLIMALPSDGSVGSESYLFFFHAVRASLLMFSSTNMVPDIVPGTVAGSWNVFYRPFVSNSAVAECMTRLESVYPQLEGCVRLRAKGDADGAVLLGESAGTLHAVCVLLTHLVCAFNYNGKKVASPERGSFFDNQPYSAVNFSDKSNGLVAKRWLSVFRLLSVEAQVLLKLDEVVPGDEQAPYSVELFFRDSEERPAMASGGMDDTTDESTTASPRKATKMRQVAALVDPAASGWETPRKFMSVGSRQSQDALKFVVALRDYIPAVEALLQDGRAEIEADLFEQFILERSGVLRSLGTSLLLPKGIKEVLQPRLVTELSMMSDDADKATWKKSYLKFAELLSFNYRVMLGDECVDLEVFHEMVAKGRRLFQFKGKFVELDPQNIANILAARNKAPPKPADAMELLRDVISGDLKYSMSEMVSELMADIQRVEKPAVPGDLKAELRPYQVGQYARPFAVLSVLVYPLTLTLVVRYHCICRVVIR
jgi:SNF2 Helicase protein